MSFSCCEFAKMAFVSILLIVVLLSTCDFLRRMIRANASPSLTRNLILDFLISVELCATSFELGAVLDEYGLAIWSFGLFLVVVYQVLRWKDYSAPTPHEHLMAHLEGGIGVGEAILRSGVLLAAGLVSYRLAKAVWRLEFSTLHVGRPGLLDACVFPWIDVPWHQSFLSEAIGSFVLGIGPRLVGDSPTLANNDPIYSAVAISIMVTVAVVIAIPISGGMFNPMLASVLLGGCEGHTTLEHILIYYVGATVGAVAAFKVYPMVEKAVYGSAAPAQSPEKKEK